MDESEKNIIRECVLQDVTNERIVYQSKKRDYNEAVDKKMDKKVIDDCDVELRKAYDNLYDRAFESSVSCEIALRAVNSSLEMEEDFREKVEKRIKKMKEEQEQKENTSPPLI